MRIVIVRTWDIMVSGFLQVAGLSPALVLLVQIFAIHLYFTYCDNVINKFNEGILKKLHLFVKNFI